MAARINHSSNLREITPCNRSAGFVISARSAVKRPRCIVSPLPGLAETTGNRMFRLIGAKRLSGFFARPALSFGTAHRPRSCPASSSIGRVVSRSRSRRATARDKFTVSFLQKVAPNRNLDKFSLEFKHREAMSRNRVSREYHPGCKRHFRSRQIRERDVFLSFFLSMQSNFLLEATRIATRVATETLFCRC